MDYSDCMGIRDVLWGALLPSANSLKIWWVCCYYWKPGARVEGDSRGRR